MAALTADLKTYIDKHPEVSSDAAMDAVVKAAAKQEAGSGNDNDDDGAAGNDKSEKSTQPEAHPDSKAVDKRTKAEKDFERAQRARERELVKAKVTKTHRQRIEEFNQLLANMSEHYDIPRVGPG